MTKTIFALSSGALPAGIAVIRISGPGAEVAAKTLAGSLPPPRTLALRRLRDADGAIIDEALVVHFPAPATVTGEPMVELHCHGGRAVVQRLLARLGATSGLREAEPGEFTRRALRNGRLDLTQAEGLADLLAAETEWQRRAAVAGAAGSLRREVEDWRDRLVNLAAGAEAAIDYVDEDETELDLTALVEAARLLAAEWTERLSSPTSELLQDGLRVVLAGPPNAGKSSLFNALVGSERAIVTPVAGTTRDVLEARLDMSGVPLTLIDTAGLRESADEVERIGVDRAQAAQKDADILLWLGDPEAAPAGAILVHAQADRRDDPVPAGAIAISVVTGQGLQPLRAALREKASGLLPPPDRAALNRRQAQALAEAGEALRAVRADDVVVTAECFRQALHALDRLSGRQGTEDVLDAVFGRFCLGK